MIDAASRRTTIVLGRSAVPLLPGVRWRYDVVMLQRRPTGSVVCPSCGSLVGVRDEKCYTCGRANPGLWGFGPLLRQLGTDLGFVPLVMGASTALYIVVLIASGGEIRM